MLAVFLVILCHCQVASNVAKKVTCHVIVQREDQAQAEERVRLAVYNAATEPAVAALLLVIQSRCISLSMFVHKIFYIILLFLLITIWHSIMPYCSDIQATSQDSSVHTDLTWRHQCLCILGLYRRYRNAVLLFRPPGPASAGQVGLYILLLGFIYLFRPPGPAAAGRVGLYILLLYFLY